MTKHVSRAMTSPAAPSTTGRHNLVHRVAMFGLQEEFEDFCERLAVRSDRTWATPELTANRTQAVELSDELRERIAFDNALDLELYESARKVLGRGSAPALRSRRSDPLPILPGLPA